MTIKEAISNKSLNHLYIIRFFLILLFLITSFNAHAVREITGTEKEEFSDVPIPKITSDSRYFKTGGENACKGADNVTLIRFEFTEESFDAAIDCYVTGTGYHEHLRKFVDERAEKHCNKYNKHALYRGQGQGQNKILKGLGGILTLGLSLPQSQISVSYVCEKNQDPNLIAQAEALKKKKEREETVDFVLGIIFAIVAACAIVAAGFALRKLIKDIIKGSSKFFSSNTAANNQRAGNISAINWSRVLLVIIIIIGAIIAFNSFNQPKPSSTIIMQQPSTPEREKGFDWGGFTDLMRGLERLGNPPSSNNNSHTFNKICLYSCTGITFSKNIPSTSLCPLTIKRNGQTCTKKGTDF